MKKWAAILAMAGAAWVIGVLYSGSLFLATLSNYPGVFAARWVKYRDASRRLEAMVWVWAFNIWLVVTSSIECRERPESSTCPFEEL